MPISETAEKAIAAYGGREFWQNAGTLEVEVSAKGLAFILKRRPFFNYAKMVLDVHRPYSSLIPIGLDPALKGVLDGPDVRLENADGQVIAFRKSGQ